MQIKDKTGIIFPLLHGDVYLVNLDPIIGKEIGKARPSVIIQNDIGNKFSPVTIIAPISSVKEITKPLPIMIFLKKGEGGLSEDSYIDCGQIRTVDKDQRLITKFGTLDKSKILEVDKALKISLSLQ
ncbi:MAG: type II toxin-antitoxin system PemK/MazF family toxin [Melioribacteraceae bacterium]|nr:type II toxin-antitoxin system PemK/MazF family toxin [Melioribacteraceae bacterium]MCF8356919.1 type II toxin-antitoxin system PemK/MazF family toxin [Melioribacteraceae bacterium]MCF8394112.1 type II toxin-antitoxin system PemK/MazF family toxin [Melioribacteraceae bacterium]MCF8418150.1 type II toxin-antitoxin system PemK/MazF family toxin [Melioribacteraceae bacterium]